MYQVEPELEQRLYAAQKLLMDKYVDPSSASYVGDNPVEVIEADLLTRSLVIVVNPDKVVHDGSNIPSETEVDGLPVRIEYGKTELV